MNVYVSSHDKELAREAAEKLRTKGHTVVSTWHDEGGDTSADWVARAQDNRQKILESDALVLLSGLDKYTGGKFFEAGLAAAYHRPIYVVGRFENGLISGVATLIQSPDEI